MSQGIDVISKGFSVLSLALKELRNYRTTIGKSPKGDINFNKNLIVGTIIIFHVMRKAPKNKPSWVMMNGHLYTTHQQYPNAFLPRIYSVD